MIPEAHLVGVVDGVEWEAMEPTADLPASPRQNRNEALRSEVPTSMFVLVMTRNRTRSARLATWLCLVVAGVVSLLPPGGVTVCLGSDGHVGFGPAAEAGECPCARSDRAHGSTLWERGDRSEPSHGHGGPCSDVQLDPPEILADSGFARALAASGCDAVEYAINGCSLHIWFLKSDCSTCRPPGQPTHAAASPVREHHVHKRTIALLI